MAKANHNHESNNHNQSGTKVRSIDELLAAKRANNQLGRSKATETIEKASNVVRSNTGKATRAELQNDLVKSAELAQAHGEEDGIKQFLTEDIPAVVKALQGELKTKHQETLASNESKLLESSVIDADWESINTDFDMSFETQEWLLLEGNTEVKSLPSTNDDNPFNSDDLPE
ncbi:hypothetical protein [Pleurocapsa sp. PCC 7319]|uniref:hypothetical protein n=1 Tax=Pleurocapsa sp. PCC 7319 TaxID=118161 RepID=UPI00034B7660|nr:hypothetical protein [Pleurocapsa sp. PCC 7319]